MLTPGQAHDLTCAEPLLAEADPEALIGDKAYDADPLLDTLATPAKKPRTECCCQWVARMMAAMVAPSGRPSIASTRACFEPGRPSLSGPV